jgi:signal transduction histidine kinase
VHVDLSRTEGGVRLAVSDRGIGIAPEHQRRIFEHFERATSARHYGGFGLGLWIARQIVESSGGTIAVDSAPGRGSTFVVELPSEAPAH